MLCATVSHAETLRIVTFNTELSRKGPGLLVRDLMAGPDGKNGADIDAVLDVLVRIKPDIAVLQSIDYDHERIALLLMRERLSVMGLDLPFAYAGPPNTGLDTGFDLDRDGRLGRARDKHGFGFYRGQGGIAILSRFPIAEAELRDFTGLLWADLPAPSWPENYYTDAEKAALRLHTIAAWEVPIDTPGGRLNILTSHAGPPVFDGPENRNGLRSSDEIAFWQLLIEGRLPQAPPPAPFIVMGDFNADPSLGEGAHGAINALRSHERLQDPVPRGAQDAPHTVDWPEGPGRLRVDYILPSARIEVLRSHIDRSETSSRHFPVILDVKIPAELNNS